jgi:uncharacterized membrane protein (DUF485 family)
MGLILLSAGYALYHVIGRVDWLGELHILLDHKFFGFLDKSNEIIFRTLASALEPDEQKASFRLSPDKKGELTQSVFSNLSDDNHLFEALLKSGIFRRWIYYWIAIYGTAAFTLLTLVAFVQEWFGSSAYVKTVFTVNWILALGHLTFSIFLGQDLVQKTKNAVQHIVDQHSREIAAVLRETVHKSEVVLNLNDLKDGVESIEGDEEKEAEGDEE